LYSCVSFHPQTRLKCPWWHRSGFLASWKRLFPLMTQRPSSIEGT
jgi:hypothetical protein